MQLYVQVCCGEPSLFLGNKVRIRWLVSWEYIPIERHYCTIQTHLSGILRSSAVVQ